MGAIRPMCLESLPGGCLHEGAGRHPTSRESLRAVTAVSWPRAASLAGAPSHLSVGAPGGAVHATPHVPRLSHALAV